MRGYITIAHGMSGHYAVHVIDDIPEATGVGRYHTASEAIEEAKSWAELDGLPYVGPEPAKGVA